MRHRLYGVSDMHPSSGDQHYIDDEHARRNINDDDDDDVGADHDNGTNADDSAMHGRDRRLQPKRHLVRWLPFCWWRVYLQLPVAMDRAYV